MTDNGDNVESNSVDNSGNQSSNEDIHNSEAIMTVLSVPEVRMITSENEEKEATTEYLSTLPFDCKLDIFRFLDRKALDAMKSVSQYFHSIATHSSFKNIKYRRDYLVMGQTKDSETHAFNLTSTADEPVLGCWYTRNDSGNRLMKGKIPKRKTGNVASVTVPEPRDEKLPRPLLSQLKEAMHSYTTKSISFVNFHIDSESVEELASAFSEARADSVLLKQVVFPEGNALEQILTTSQFGRLLLQLNPSVIKSYPEDRVARLMVFDEHFLVRYGARKDVSLLVYTMPAQTKSAYARFCVTDKNWRIIAQYKQLRLQTMIMDTKWLLDLMLLRLHSFPHNTGWTFEVTSFLTNFQLTAQNTDTIEYHLVPSGGHIVHVDTSNYVYFTIDLVYENRYLMCASFFENWSADGKETMIRSI